jgi:asparagine synthase (glutamine-hydrolysing)
MTRDPFGLRRCYYDLEGRLHAPTVREILQRLPELPRTLDPVAVAAHLEGRTTPDRSFLANVRAVPPGHTLIRTADGYRIQAYEIEPKAGDLPVLLRAAIARAMTTAPNPIAVALSGGLDSALVLALAHEIDPTIPAIVLAPALERYSELEDASHTARAVGATLEVAHVTAEDLRDALPDAIAAMEVPLYNLHPVGKLLLARAAAQAGFATLLTGDGADHMLTRDTSADYLPLVGAAFDAAGVDLRSPFLDDAVMAHFLSHPIDPQKLELRSLGATLPIPQRLVHEQKVSRLAPPIDLSPVVPRQSLANLAALLGRALPDLHDDRDHVRWSTLALLVDTFEACSTLRAP